MSICIHINLIHYFALLITIVFNIGMHEISPENKPTYVCPEQTYIDLTLAGIEEFKDEHQMAGTVKGMMVVHQFLLDLAQEKFECDGPVMDSFGQLVCPLKETVMRARGATSMPWSSSTIRLERIYQNDDVNDNKPPEERHGQYL